MAQKQISFSYSVRNWGKLVELSLNMILKSDVRMELKGPREALSSSGYLATVIAAS